MIDLFEGVVSINKNSKKLKVTWDGQEIDDLIKFLKSNTISDSVIREEHPAPIHITNMFPHVIAMDKSSRCLMSCVDYSVEMVSDLIDRKLIEDVSTDYIEFGYPIEARKDVSGLRFDIGFVIAKGQSCYYECLLSRSIAYYNSDLSQVGLPDENDNIEWAIITNNAEMVIGHSKGLDQATLDASLKSAEMQCG